MNLLLSILLLLLTSSLSAQQYYFVVEERQPAERTLLQGQQRVLVVNNTISQPNDFGHSNAEDGTLIEGSSIDLRDAALRCLFAATQSMDDSGEYERVELMDISQNTSGVFYTRHPMTLAAAEQLCTDYDVDALLILNQLVLYDLQESYPTDDAQYFAYLQACSQAHWTIHYAGKAQDATFTTADTLVWESEIYPTRAEVLAEMPERQSALLYLSQYVGETLGVSLTPQWREEKHYIYDNDNEYIQRGLKFFQRKDWDGAVEQWLQVLDPSGEVRSQTGSQTSKVGDSAGSQTSEVGGKKDKVTKKDRLLQACAAANIAVSYEMKADYAKAIVYTNKAITLFKQCNTSYGRQQMSNMNFYLQHIKVRRSFDNSSIEVGNE